MNINRVISNQIRAIRHAGWTAVRRLLYRLLRVVFLILLLVPVSIPLVIFIRLIRPWVLIRLHPISAHRLGHFALNCELYLCERDHGINVPRGNYADLGYYVHTYVSNTQLEKMWRRHLNIWPAWLLDPVYKLNRLLPGQDAHFIGERTFHDRDVNNLMDSPPHLYFTNDEDLRGQAELLALGIPRSAKFICLISRDDAYLRTLVNPGGNFDHDHFRNASIENFLVAAEALADQGYYVIRMGKVVSSPLRSVNPKIIDYASSNFRNDFMDIYLGANCFFCIGIGSGFDEIPKLFRRPVCYVNIVPIGYLCTFQKESLAISKKLWLGNEQRWLTLREIFDEQLGYADHADEYKARNVSVVENSPEEIKNLVMEMLARLNGEWNPRPEDEELQARFWNIFPTKARDIYRGTPLHSSINMRYGAEYLRNNIAWLA